MNPLLVAELLVRAEMRREEELEKQAASFLGALRGGARIAQETAGALGQGLRRELPGRTGRVLGGIAEAAPAAAALGAGVYGVETLAGSPIKKFLRAKKQQIKSRLGAHGQTQSVFDPSTGRWY